MKCCTQCRHFTDAHLSRTYISPTCTAQGEHSAAFMREFICGVDEARLFEIKESAYHNGSKTA